MRYTRTRPVVDLCSYNMLTLCMGEAKGAEIKPFSSAVLAVCLCSRWLVTFLVSSLLSSLFFPIHSMYKDTSYHHLFFLFLFTSVILSPPYIFLIYLTLC